MKLVLEEIGRRVGVEIKSDSSSGISTASRLGQGRLKHLELKQLAIQTWIRRRVVRLGRVDSAHNHGDLLAKNLPPKFREFHCEALGLRSETRPGMEEELGRVSATALASAWQVSFLFGRRS